MHLLWIEYIHVIGNLPTSHGHITNYLLFSLAIYFLNTVANYIAMYIMFFYILILSMQKLIKT